jgi:uncharacterized protein
MVSQEAMVRGALTISLWDLHSPVLRKLYAGNGPCHDAGHALRVARIAEYLAGQEGVDPLLPVLAGLFHDCGHGTAKRHSTDDHETRSAEAAAEALRDTLPAGQVAELVVAIEGRRFRKRAATRSAVGAILDDADNLDAIGSVGLARALMWMGEHGIDNTEGTGPQVARRVADRLRAHWDEKLSLLTAGMHTEAARRLAEARHRRLAAALDTLNDEVAW